MFAIPCINAESQEQANIVLLSIRAQTSLKSFPVSSALFPHSFVPSNHLHWHLYAVSTRRINNQLHIHSRLLRTYHTSTLLHQSLHRPHRVRHKNSTCISLSFLYFHSLLARYSAERITQPNQSISPNSSISRGYPSIQSVAKIMSTSPMPTLLVVYSKDSRGE